ncbi:MAG: ATP-dependent sacrificial sulfur transferase LarE [Myxococcales bacterium]|nr:ATP-dependent sacrificial sulfur transferase LarE [Myxococcales bacterium]
MEPFAAYDADVARKHERLKERLRELGSVVVGFSGGVDSGVLVQVAHEALGNRALAVTASSATLPQAEFEAAGRVAREIGAAHVVLESHEIERGDFAKNLGNRCYFCKSELFELLGAEAARRGFAHVAYGATVDDLGDHRPGMDAAREAGAAAPLLDVGLTKREIRAIGRERGLSIWDKPSFACLSSRFAYGNVITVDKLSKVESAEALLRARGFRQFRVRVHDGLARIEVPAEDLDRFLSSELRAEVVEHLKKLGYTYVTLDLQGFRSGSMNEAS